MRIEKFYKTIIMLEPNRKEAKDQIKRFTRWQRSILYWHGSHHALVMPKPKSIPYFKAYVSAKDSFECDECQEFAIGVLFVQSTIEGLDLWLCAKCHSTHTKLYKSQMSKTAQNEE